MTREEILNEIRRTASENGGKPLGRSRFEQVSGITEYDIGRFWPRWGDAVREAGFEPNRLNPAFDREFLITKYAGLVRKLGRVPTRPEMRLERRHDDPTFPTVNVYDRCGSKDHLVAMTLRFCRDRPDLSDTVLILEAYKPRTAHVPDEDSASEGAGGYGFVYLVLGHRGEYKIGRTSLVDRRLPELGAMASVEPQLIHEIKTDDPVGVEAYWHLRFDDRRMRGEWFKLSASDVRAFKRWKRVY